MPCGTRSKKDRNTKNTKNTKVEHILCDPRASSGIGGQPSNLLPDVQPNPVERVREGTHTRIRDTVPPPFAREP